MFSLSASGPPWKAETGGRPPEVPLEPTEGSQWGGPSAWLSVSAPQLLVTLGSSNHRFLIAKCRLPPSWGSPKGSLRSQRTLFLLCPFPFHRYCLSLFSLSSHSFFPLLLHTFTLSHPYPLLSIHLRALIPSLQLHPHKSCDVYAGASPGAGIWSSQGNQSRAHSQSVGISSQSCDLEVVPGTGLWREHSHQRSQQPSQIRPFVCLHESSSFNTCQPSTASEMVPPSPGQPFLEDS